MAVRAPDGGVAVGAPSASSYTTSISSSVTLHRGQLVVEPASGAPQHPFCDIAGPLLLWKEPDAASEAADTLRESEAAEARKRKLAEIMTELAELRERLDMLSGERLAAASLKHAYDEGGCGCGDESVSGSGESDGDESERSENETRSERDKSLSHTSGPRASSSLLLGRYKRVISVRGNKHKNQAFRLERVSVEVLVKVVLPDNAQDDARYDLDSKVDNLSLKSLLLFSLACSSSQPSSAATVRPLSLSSPPCPRRHRQQPQLLRTKTTVRGVQA